MIFNAVINCGSYLIRDDRSWSSPLPCPPHVLPFHSKAVPLFFFCSVKSLKTGHLGWLSAQIAISCVWIDHYFIFAWICSQDVLNMSAWFAAGVHRRCHHLFLMFFFFCCCCFFLLYSLQTVECDQEVLMEFGKCAGYVSSCCNLLQIAHLYVDVKTCYVFFFFFFFFCKTFHVCMYVTLKKVKPSCQRAHLNRIPLFISVENWFLIMIRNWIIFLPFM